MKFTRITITLGVLAVLLLSGGCASLVETGASSAQAPGDDAGAATAEQAQASVAAEVSDKSAETTIAARQPAPQPAAPAASLPPATPAPATAPTQTAPAPVVTDPAVTDMWQRLRDNFRLSDRRLDPRRLHYFETWYAARPKYFERLTERARWFLPYVLEEVEKRGMPGEIALLPAIESAFRLDAVSRSRAVGLWQFISATGRRYGLRQDWWVDERRDLIQSTRAALDYLSFLEKEFNGDWELALASYNAGEGAVRRAVKRNLKLNRSGNYTALKLRRETTDYVPKLLAVRNIISRPHAFGIALPPLPDQHTLAVIDARSQTDLSVAASLSDLGEKRLSAKQLRYFNQGYKRGTTPPNGPHTLVVPVEHAPQMLAALNRLSFEARLRWARHQVRKGENLSVIAHKYGVSVASVMNANNLTSSLIHPRQELRIPLSLGNYQYAESSTPKVHKVRRGDSLWGISRRYGVSIDNLTRWNRIPRNALLHPGQSLVVGR